MPGVKRIEATSAQLGSKTRPLAFFGVLLIAYAISIDGVSLTHYQKWHTLMTSPFDTLSKPTLPAPMANILS